MVFRQYGGVKIHMMSVSRLGGFKILKDVVWMSFMHSGDDTDFPTLFCSDLAQRKINLEFLTIGKVKGSWSFNAVFQLNERKKLSDYMQKYCGDVKPNTTDAAIVSVFPHKSDPGVAASLFGIFESHGISPNAVANSNSALSTVLSTDALNHLTKALFTPFRFGTYRTPTDWKLAQKGKEHVYKEVIASYQEKAPKVYALQYQTDQELLHVSMKPPNLIAIEKAFRDLASFDIRLTFLITGAVTNRDHTTLSFCLPKSLKRQYHPILDKLPSDSLLSKQSPVAHFSMNGPHFGDRYGIASELLRAFEREGIDMLGLSCSIASITGVLPADQIQSAIQIIQGSFDVPSIIENNPFPL